MAARLKKFTVTIVNPKTIDDSGIKTETVYSIGGSVRSAALWMEAMNPGWHCTNVVRIK
jgi:hypothetical protein